MVDRLSTSLAQQLGINTILSQQITLNQTQQQISLGKRILSPSDDPAGAVQLLDLSESLSRLEQFQGNLDYARNRLSLSEGTLNGVSNNLQRVRELAVQGFNSTNTATDKQSIALEIFQRVDELAALANTKDANGDYLYAGFKAQTEPFSGSAATGSFSYNGDQGVRYLKIGENRTISDGNAGAEVFFDLQDKDGNAESMFATLYGLATDLSNDRPATEESTFTLANNPADNSTLIINGVTYEFDGNASGATVGGATVVTIGGSTAATINALKIAVDGATVPAGKSAVTTSASSNQLTITASTEGEGQLDALTGTSITGNNTATTVSTPLYDHLDQLDTALGRILDVRAQLGARLNVLDSQDEINQDFELSIETTRSEIEDLDMAEAISRFNLQIVALQAAQQAFIKVQNLSLFNLL
ncbi:MAG: flagellar hook-associated protein FlgL [Cycloclasticus sp.]